MSDKMPYYAIDKVAATISLDAKARVKWENRAAECGEKVTTHIAKFLEAEVRDDPFTIADKQRADAYMDALGARARDHPGAGITREFAHPPPPRAVTRKRGNS